MRWKLGAGSWGLLPLLAAGSISAQATSVTLFNSGRVLVRRTLPIAIPIGSSTQAFELGNFEPTSLTTLDAGVTVTGVRFDPSWSEDALLRRNVGRRFQFARAPSGTVTATLIALDPERWRYDSSGSVIFGRPGQIQWPAQLVPTAPATDVSLRSDRARRGLRVMYQTSGAAWNATFRIFLGSPGRIEGVAAIGAGALDLADVDVQLLAGDIGRAMPSPMRMSMAKAPGGFDEAGIAPAQTVSEQAVGEAHLYTLPSRITFLPGLQLTVPLFEPTVATGERRLAVGGGLPYYGGFEQQSDEATVPVEVAYRFERKLGTPFGDLVLPGGSVSLFQADAAGRQQLIGQGAIGHTPAGKELLISTGTAFDVTATRVQTDFSVTRAAAPNMPMRTVALASYRVTLQNAKDSAVAVEVREGRGGEWSVVESSVPFQKRSSTRVVFPVTVAPKGTAVLTYRVRVVW